MADAIPVTRGDTEPQPPKAPEIVGEPPEEFDMVGVMNAQKVIFHPNGGYSVYW